MAPEAVAKHGQVSCDAPPAESLTFFCCLICFTRYEFPRQDAADAELACGYCGTPLSLHPWRPTKHASWSAPSPIGTSLLEELPEMEAELIGYVQSNGSKYIAGYEVEAYDGRFSLRNLDPPVYRQLRLKIDQDL